MMNNLQWPPACVGCGATTNLQSENIGRKYGDVNICICCIGIARIEQMLNRGWKLAFAILSYLLSIILLLGFGYTYIQSLFVGLTTLVPILLIEGLLSKIKYSESFLEIKKSNQIVFRDSLFSNLFASSNPEMNTELDLSFHSGDSRRNRLGLSILSILTFLLISLIVLIDPIIVGSYVLEQIIIVFAYVSIQLVSAFIIGVISFYVLIFIWSKRMTLRIPNEQEIPELSLHTPTIRTGPIRSKGDSTFGQNVEVDLGQRSIMEKFEDAIHGGDFTDAARLCRKAIDIDPLNIEAWKSLAIAHAKSGKCIESRDALQRARDLAQDPKQMESTLAKCKEHCGDIFDLPPTEIIPLVPVTPTTSDETEKYRRQIDENPMSPQIWAKMATVLARSGRCIDARDALQRAKDIDPKESMIENAMKTCKECCIEEFSGFELD